MSQRETKIFPCLPLPACLPPFLPCPPALPPALLPLLGFHMLNVPLLNSHPEIWISKGMFQLAHNNSLQRKTALRHFTKHDTKREKHAHLKLDMQNTKGIPRNEVFDLKWKGDLV